MRDISKMNAEQVARALAEVDGGFNMLGDLTSREELLEREMELREREKVVGKPLRGVSLDLALAGDRDSLRQAIQHALASLESGQLDSSRLHEALRRSDELGAKWTEREREAVELARQNEGLRFELTVAHGALKRQVSGLLIPEGLSVHLTGRDDVAFVAGLPDVAAVLRDYDGVLWLHITAKRSVFHAVTACCIAAEAPPEALALLPEEAP